MDTDAEYWKNKYYELAKQIEKYHDSLVMHEKTEMEWLENNKHRLQSLLRKERA